jgi:two-component system sensor histidine kinase MtrB
VVVAVVAGVLAGGAFLAVREYRLRGSVDGSIDRARESLVFAAQNLPADPAPADLTGLVDEFTGLGLDTAIRAPAGTVQSRTSLGLQQVPGDLKELVRSGQLAYQRATTGGVPYLVVGGRTGVAELYFFFSEESLRRGLFQLGLVILGGWASVVVLTALFVLAGLQSRVAALSEAQARERRFTSDVAHELRTPLSALVAEASVLREHLDRVPQEARRPAELLVEDVGRLRRLVEDLMEVARLDAARDGVTAEAPEPEPVDVGALVGATLRARGWDPRVDLRVDDVVVQTDRRRLERIVANLVGNALEHGGRDVRVHVGRNGAEAFVEVSDRGPGIAREHLPHLFERFYKADPSRTGPGSGLGLAIAWENARLLGGDIDVRSEPGEGTRFTLRLPRP